MRTVSVILLFFIVSCFCACAGQKHRIVSLPSAYSEQEAIKVFFRFDSDELLTKYINTLDPLINYQKEYPRNTIIIEGHTDQWGTDPYNKDLGDRRAKAIKAYLIENGVEADKIIAVSYGKNKPDPLNIDFNKNRRVVIKNIND